MIIESPLEKYHRLKHEAESARQTCQYEISPSIKILAISGWHNKVEIFQTNTGYIRISRDEAVSLIKGLKFTFGLSE